MVWAIAAAVVSGDRAELVGALVRSFIAVPAVAITLWLTGHVLNAVDDMTWYILNGEGASSIYSTLQSVMWAGGQANYFFAFLIHGLLMLGMLLLMLVFAFRNIVLAALIMVGPVAWMLFPVREHRPAVGGPVRVGGDRAAVDRAAHDRVRHADRQWAGECADDLESAVLAAAGRAWCWWRSRRSRSSDCSASPARSPPTGSAPGSAPTAAGWRATPPASPHASPPASAACPPASAPPATDPSTTGPASKPAPARPISTGGTCRCAEAGAGTLDRPERNAAPRPRRSRHHPAHRHLRRRRSRRRPIGVRDDRHP